MRHENSRESPSNFAPDSVLIEEMGPLNPSEDETVTGLKDLVISIDPKVDLFFFD